VSEYCSVCGSLTVCVWTYQCKSCKAEVCPECWEDGYCLDCLKEVDEEEYLVEDDENERREL